MPQINKESQLAASSSSTQQFLEVAKRSYKIDEKKITEVLAHIISGKSYHSSPEIIQEQSPQKGGTCWYYALNRIRTRYGKESPDHQARIFEKAISSFRKELTTLQSFESTLETVSTHKLLQRNMKDSTIEGISSELANCILDDYEEHSELQFKKALSFIQNVAVSLSEGHSFNQEKFNLELYNHFYGMGLVPKRELFSEEVDDASLNAAFKMISEHFTNNQSDVARLELRLSILFLAIAFFFKDLVTFNDELKASEFLGLIPLALKLQAYKRFFSTLNIKPELSFFENFFSDDETTKIASPSAQADAKTFYENFNTLLKDEIKFNLTKKQIDELNFILDISRAFIIKKSIELYDLKPSSWQPKQGIEELMRAIEQHGAMVVFGRAIGTPAYKNDPNSVDDDGNSLILGSRKILFWNSTNQEKNEHVAGHAIVIIGAQRIEENNEARNYVFYLDPNDGSKPGEERVMYRMTYETLKKQLLLINGFRLADNDRCRDDHVFAVTKP